MPELACPGGLFFLVSYAIVLSGLCVVSAAAPLLSSHKAWAATPPACVVVRIHSKQRNGLLPTYASLVHSAPLNTRVIFVDTGDEAFTELPSLVADFNQLTEQPLAQVSRWDQKLSRAQFPNFTANDFGYIATDLVIEDLLEERADARRRNASLPCELLLVTNGDNLYGRAFFEATIGALSAEAGVGLVATHFVSHYYWWTPEKSGKCGPFRDGSDAEFATCMGENNVDLGAVLMRTSLFETLTLIETTHPKRFVVDRLRIDKESHPRTFSLDGQLFGFFASKTGTKVIRRTLFVHQ